MTRIPLFLATALLAASAATPHLAVPSAAVPFAALPSAAEPAPRPNFVILFSDDAGWADFGFQGSNVHTTPAIDSIAAGGVRFEQAYVTSPICSPSRAGMLTGRYQQRFGHEYNLPGMDDPAVPDRMRGLPLQEQTLADLLRAHGYATGLVGKWHLGLHPRFRPQQRGFDEFFGMAAGSSPYQSGTNDRIFDGDRRVPPEELPYITDAFGDRAVDFIERHRSEPFFLFLSFNAPHTPLEAKTADLDSLQAHFQTRERALNVAMTRALDDNVGKVLAALDRLDLADNTLVIFTNDNGGAMPYNASLNAPLRGTKGTMLEGGVRVPFAARWPARLEAGSSFAAPVSTLDILPTFLAAAGVSMPEEREFDGVDLLPYLSGKASGRPHETLFWRVARGAAVRRGDWKLVRTPADEHWLFDLAADPSETSDLATEHPDLAAALRAQLEAWESGLAPPVWVTAPRWEEHSLERYDQATVDGFIRR